MQWTKLKKEIESRFSETVSGRVAIHCARYRKASTDLDRAWITIDKEEIHEFSNIKTLWEEWRQTYQISKENNWPVDEGYPWNSTSDAREMGKKATFEKGVYSRILFYMLLEGYLNLSFEKALESKNLVFKAFAMLDRRLGKRRLKTLDVGKDHPLVKKLYDFRCSVENL